VDGDTVKTGSGETVRLLGVDAAEPGEPCSTEPTNALKQAVADQNVSLESAGHGTDRYNRLLRYVYVNGTNINLALVRNGVARARVSPDIRTYREELIAAENRARTHNAGCSWDLPEPQHTVSACNATGFTGEPVAVRGTVVDAGMDADTGTVFLNFEHPYPEQCFTAVIFSGSRHRFPDDPATYYAEKIVTVQGTVSTGENGVPEMVLASENAVTIRNP
jgi:hypothetical protein